MKSILRWLLVAVVFNAVYCGRSTSQHNHPHPHSHPHSHSHRPKNRQLTQGDEPTAMLSVVHGDRDNGYSLKLSGDGQLTSYLKTLEHVPESFYRNPHILTDMDESVLPQSTVQHQRQVPINRNPHMPIPAIRLERSDTNQHELYYDEDEESNDEETTNGEEQEVYMPQSRKQVAPTYYDDDSNDEETKPAEGSSHRQSKSLKSKSNYYMKEYVQAPRQEYMISKEYLERNRVPKELVVPYDEDSRYGPRVHEEAPEYIPAPRDLPSSYVVREREYVVPSGRDLKDYVPVKDSKSYGTNMRDLLKQLSGSKDAPAEADEEYYQPPAAPKSPLQGYRPSYTILESPEDDQIEYLIPQSPKERPSKPAREQKERKEIVKDALAGEPGDSSSSKKDEPVNEGGKKKTSKSQSPASTSSPPSQSLGNENSNQKSANNKTPKNKENVDLKTLRAILATLIKQVEDIQVATTKIISGSGLDLPAPISPVPVNPTGGDKDEPKVENKKNKSTRRSSRRPLSPSPFNEKKVFLKANDLVKMLTGDDLIYSGPRGSARPAFPVAAMASMASATKVPAPFPMFPYPMMGMPMFAGPWK